MKILHVTNFFKPSWEGGGPAKATYEISKKMVERGHQVTVYTTDGYKSRVNVKKNSPLNVEGIRTYYFSNISKNLASKLVFPLPYASPFLIRKNIKSFDIIHIHEYRTFLAIFIHYYAKKNNVPYILQARGSVLPFFQKQRLKSFFDSMFKNILLDASKLIALNEREAEEYIMMGVDKNKIKILPNGIDPSEYSPLPQKGLFRKKYSIGHEDKIILFLGRIHKIKGVELLVNSFSILLDKMKNITLVIAGPDDGLLPFLQKQVHSLNISNKVIFTGPLYEKDKIEAYVDADIYVLPSVSECFPNTILEAFACKKAVIVTNGCGIRDTIDNRAGYAVEYDVVQLSDSMFKLLTDIDIREKFEKEAYKLVYEKFTWDKIVTDMEFLYNECIQCTFSN